MVRAFALLCGFGMGICLLLGTTAHADGTSPARTGEADLTRLIDSEIEKGWKAAGVTPAKTCTDEEFLRRVYLDTIGSQPTVEDARGFLDDKSADKRAKLIDKLVADARFGERMADTWTNILMGRGLRGQGGGAGNLFAIWLAERLNKGHSFSAIAYDMLTATGKLSENPAVGLYLTMGGDFKAADFAGEISKNLTGVQIQCAQCHTHPYEKWTMDDFAGMASFFAPVQVRIDFENIPPDPVVSDQGEIPARLVNALREGDKVDPIVRARAEELAKYNAPKALGADAVKTKDRTFWRPIFAKWLTAKDNLQTRRYVVNRFWSFAFGRGLHNPVDDFNSETKATHPELLEALARDFVASGDDYKRLYRAILKSRAWQLSSTREGDKAPAPETYAVFPIRQLTPEQFFGSLITISGGDKVMNGLRQYFDDGYDRLRKMGEKEAMEPKNPNERERTYQKETLERFVKLSSRMSSSWLARRKMSAQYASMSSDDEMTEVDGFALSIDQALAVMNGTVTTRLSGSGPGTLLGQLMAEVKQPEERIKSLYATVLSREPSAAELKRLTEYLDAGKHSGKAYEDVLFSLLMTTEFATNH